MAKPGSVIGWLLAQSDRDELLSQFPPKFEKTVAHHVTLKTDAESDPLPPDVRAAIVGRTDDEAGVEAMALSTLVAHRRRNGRNPDLAVTVVEVCVFASGVLLLLRCLGHFHNPELQSLPCVCPQAHKMVHEWGGIARQIVWSRDICDRPAAPSIIGVAMVNRALSCCGQSRFVCWPNWCTATFLQQVHRKVITNPPEA